MPQYATNTSVPVEKSKAEIERLLQRYGASKFASGWDEHSASIAFEIHGLRVRFNLPLPDRQDPKFRRHSRGVRTPESAHKAWEQACRQRWRALALAIKAKLEAVECGITTFEQEFLAHIVLPNGTTVGNWMVPQLEEAYSNGSMPPLLPAGAS
jgi:hypothetical protein